MSEREKVVEVRELCTEFPIRREITDMIRRKPAKSVKAVNQVSLDVYKGESLGLVGESGCGKSTLAKTIVRLCNPKSGMVLINGENITRAEGKQLRKMRRNVQMIFQDPYSSLNPRMTVYETIEEVLKVHHLVPKEQLEERV